MNPLVIPQVPFSGERFPAPFVITSEGPDPSMGSKMHIQTLHCVEPLPTAIDITLVGSFIAAISNKRRKYYSIV